MASKRRKRRVQDRLHQERVKRQCANKMVYTSEVVARASAAAVSKIKQEDLREYRCPLCSTVDQSRYHIGHDPSLKGVRMKFPV